MTPTPPPSAKQRVLEWVRSKNPQTMELKFGCKIIVNNENATVTDSYSALLDFQHPDDKESRSISVVTYVTGRQSCMKIHGEAIKVHRSGKTVHREKLEILGSDMGLQELLIAYCKTNNWILSSASNEFGKVVNEEIENILEDYDLTKNLHEQSEDFYQSILPLMPSE